MRIVRARNMRAFGRHGRGIKIFINIIGTFLIRSIERSERIYHAICSRGFDGRINLLRDTKLKFTDVMFALISVSVFIILRMYDIAELIGAAVLKF